MSQPPAAPTKRVVRILWRASLRVEIARDQALHRPFPRVFASLGKVDANGMRELTLCDERGDQSAVVCVDSEATSRFMTEFSFETWQVRLPCSVWDRGAFRRAVLSLDALEIVR